MDYLQISIELLVGFIALFILTKVLGKLQINQITVFDFISALVLGELVGNALFDDEIGIGKILFAITGWGILIYVVEFMTQKIKRWRSFLEGQPTIVISMGKIDYKALKKNNLDLNQLQHLLRSKDVFSISEVEYAILETDASISVLKKDQYNQPTKQDHHMSLQGVYLPITVILDGEVVRDNLQQTGHDEAWLLKQLKKHGHSSINDVLYAEWRQNQPLHVQGY
ncbi:DUF421 domain-containing protein [Bacillus sp. HMF5848]|uniref:DUF421 domain-containing protein n=1 Tax=Bacillus sp. HMF5848 TaxID=2495421 RepID=UPI001639A317|nr:DUF421 domain-containing protein [Bacillus sp. HMF5848]